MIAMPDREVKLGLMTYTDEKGNTGQIGYQGDTVKVHPDFLERFDELNVQPGGDEPFQPMRVSNSMFGAVNPEEAMPEAEAKKAAPKKAT